MTTSSPTILTAAERLARVRAEIARLTDDHSVVQTVAADGDERAAPRIVTIDAKIATLTNSIPQIEHAVAIEERAALLADVAVAHERQTRIAAAIERQREIVERTAEASHEVAAELQRLRTLSPTFESVAHLQALTALTGITFVADPSGDAS